MVKTGARTIFPALDMSVVFPRTFEIAAASIGTWQSCARCYQCHKHENVVLRMKQVFSWLNSQQAELRFGLRIAFAGVAAFALAQILHLPQGYWAVFTAVLVTQ